MLKRISPQVLVVITCLRVNLIVIESDTGYEYSFYRAHDLFIDRMHLTYLSDIGFGQVALVIMTFISTSISNCPLGILAMKPHQN